MSLRRSRVLGSCFALGLIGLGACSTEKADAPKPCCAQPEIPAGVTPFTVVYDETTGPSDGQKVVLRVGLQKPAKRDAIYPVLHTLYRYAMNRNAFQPTQVTVEVYPSEASAKSASDSQQVAAIARSQSELSPHCDNRVPYDFTEQVDRAFAASLGAAPEENLDDTCRLNTVKKVERVDEKFTHKPSYKIDTAQHAVEVTYPYLDMGKDQYVEKLKLSSALAYWIEFTSSLFKKVADLKAVTFDGIHDDAQVLRISVSRQQFDGGFSVLQENIAAHAAVTFQALGTHHMSDKEAEKDQEAFKVKAYKEALATLPKGQVSIAPKLLKGK